MADGGAVDRRLRRGRPGDRARVRTLTRPDARTAPTDGPDCRSRKRSSIDIAGRSRAKAPPGRTEFTIVAQSVDSRWPWRANRLIRQYSQTYSRPHAVRSPSILRVAFDLGAGATHCVHACAGHIRSVAPDLDSKCRPVEHDAGRVASSTADRTPASVNSTALPRTTARAARSSARSRVPDTPHPRRRLRIQSIVAAEDRADPRQHLLMPNFW